MKVEVLVAHPYLTVCDLMDCSPPGSSNGLQFHPKDVNDNSICRTEKETQIYRTVF